MKPVTAKASAKTVGATARKKARTGPPKSKARLPAKSEAAGNEEDALADFLVGALLFSLLASNRCESVRELMTQGKGD